MKTKLMILGLVFFQFSFGQEGGNQLYQNSKNYYQNNLPVLNQSISKVRTSDNQMVFEINVLNNVRADSYVVTLGVNQESHSVETCNSAINRRILAFKTEIKKLGIKENDIYVDFITQTKIYGYHTNSEGNNVKINQKDDGYEIKKNIIFRLNDMSLFEKILEIASKSDIHNIINVEYYVSNQDLIYEKMLKEALKISDKRKDLLEISVSKYEEPVYEVSFNSIQPGNQYKNFQAFETSNISYSNYYKSNQVVVQQEQRKSKTFFFDGVDTSTFDKVMNADTPKICLQYVMNVKVIYKAKQKEKKHYHIITPNGDFKTLNLN